MPKPLDPLRAELRAWEDTLHARERDEARRIVQQQRARRRAIQHRSQPDAHQQRHLLNEAKRRLRHTQHAIKDARHAIHDKRVAIDAAEHNGRKDALRYGRSLLGRTEVPPGTNCTPFLAESFGLRCCAWCGKFCGNCMMHGGVGRADLVRDGILSVAAIEDSARAGRVPFTSWSANPASARMGDLVVLFGRGVHVELVRAVVGQTVHTYGGNTSSGTGGSQSNGGGVFARVRPFSAVHGIAHANY